jgi:hypothetical protein
VVAFRTRFCVVMQSEERGDESKHLYSAQALLNHDEGPSAAFVPSCRNSLRSGCAELVK